MISVHFHDQPARKFHCAIVGATTVLFSIMLILIGGSFTEGLHLEFGDLFSLGWYFPALQLLSAVTTAIGFVSIPQRPHIFFNERPIDRQKTVSLWQKYSFSWATVIFQAAKCKTLQLSDLPALEYEKRSRSLNSRFSKSINSGRLWCRLVYAHARPLLIQLSLTLLKSLLTFISPYII